jgi:hypothetical protein
MGFVTTAGQAKFLGLLDFRLKIQAETYPACILSNVSLFPVCFVKDGERSIMT